MTDPLCRREDCGHLRSLHTERSHYVGEGHTACAVEDCEGVCSEFIGEDRHQCERCGSWDGGLCVCYAR